MEKLTIEAVNREKLTENDFIGIHEVMQDMWAGESWLGELAQCHDCKKILSKERAFWHLSQDLSQETVANIMRILWIDSVPCAVCGGETRLIYGPSNVEKIKDRVLNSVDSFLVLCKSEEKGIIGFNEGYIDSLDRIFQLDLHDHYGNVWLAEIKHRVEKNLGYLPREILHMSAMWLLKPYRSFQNLFRMIHEYTLILPESRRGTLWIVEYNRGWVTHRMNTDVNRSISLGIEDDPELRAKMTNVWEGYNCDLIIYPDVVTMHKDFFSRDIRHYLQMSKGKTARHPEPTRDRELVTI